VTGLTVSHLLFHHGYQICVVAREMPGHRSINYASPWAGAIYRPWPDVDPQGRYEADLARETYKVFKKISEDRSSGVGFIDGIEYFENPSEAHTTLGGRYSDVDGFRVLNKHELPTGVKFGTAYKTWCVNPPVYLEWLERQLTLGGVQFVQGSLSNILEVFPLLHLPKSTIVINCSGVGFSDPNVFPTRGFPSMFCLILGQTVLVSNACDRTVNHQHPDGEWTYIIPRPLNGGTIIGGTKEKNDWNPHVDSATRDRLLARAAKIFPEIVTNGQPPSSGGFHVIADIVARRPSRHGGARIQHEVLDGKNVVHAYGVGSMGFEISWGLAREVLKIVNGVRGSKL
jgi:hypothetical protein